MCFIFCSSSSTPFYTSLADYLPPKPGPIVEKLTGKILGQHKGLWAYTVGENIKWPGQPEKLFVSNKDIEKNTIYVVPGR